MTPFKSKLHTLGYAAALAGFLVAGPASAMESVTFDTGPAGLNAGDGLAGLKPAPASSETLSGNRAAASARYAEQLAANPPRIESESQIQQEGS